MKRTKSYQTILRAGVSQCCVALLFFLAMLYKDNYWPLLVSFGVLGLSICKAFIHLTFNCILLCSFPLSATVPLLPLLMENCAESTYPVAEEFSMGIMFVGSNILVSFIFLYLKYCFSN